MAFDPAFARAELPATRSKAYFNAGTFGPLPRVAAEAMHAHVEHSTEQGRIGHAGLDRWFGLMERARHGFARSLACRAEDLALMHCTTDGCNTVVWGMGLCEGDEVVTTTHEHPGLTAPLEELARTRGVVVTPCAPTRASIVAAVGPRTKLVALSHVLWTNGDVLPVREIAEEVAVRSAGAARVLVDGAQSAGALELAIDTLGVDAYTVSGQKWLCGPSGTGALWVSPRLLGELATPWPWYLSKSRGPGGVAEWTTARRLDTSTIGMTSLAGLVEALAWHEQCVRSGAHAYAAALAGRLRASLRACACVELVEVHAPSQLVSFTVRGHGAGAVSHALEGAGVLVRPIPGVELVRASVGFWNDDADLARLVAAVSALASSGASR
jgi:L-cysteine/cystine lyase